jgi:DNA-binding CsgD family transcriptional regulator/tetratricopeptide (TPR) repeat protein
MTTTNGRPATQADDARGRAKGLLRDARVGDREESALTHVFSPGLSASTLVGRQEELTSLLRAASRPPALVLVEGEAGVGKTRLVQEFLRSPELDARQLCSGGCQHLAEPLPLGPLLDALRSSRLVRTELSPLAGALRPVLPELAPVLPPAPEPLGDPRAERHRLFRALLELLVALGQSVLVLEDLHWADEQTLEFLRFLSPQLPDELTLVCTYRGEDVPQISSFRSLGARLPGSIVQLQLRLRPLDREEVRRLAGSILEVEAMSDEFADYLFQGSGGLPFAVEEVLRLLENREDLIRRKGAWVRRSLEDLAVPRAVRDSILERLERLRPAEQALVRAAAVVGVPASEALLATVAEVRRGTETALGGALAAALLVEAREDRFCVRHELARQAVEEALPSPIRRRLHLRAAQALEKEEPKPLARLAYHYRAAGKTNEWTHYAEAAADRARSFDDAVTACRFLREALDVETLPPLKRAKLGIRFLVEAFDSFAQKDAADVVRPLLDEETLPPAVRGELRLHLGRFLCQAGEDTEGYAQISQALDDLESRPDLSATAMAFLGQPSFHAGRFDEHLKWVDRAAREAAKSDDGALRIRLAADRACTLLVLGDPRALQAIEEIPAPGSDTNEVREAARAWGNLADVLLHLGYYERARELIGRNLATGPGCFREHVIAEVTETQLDFVSGSWSGLEERVRLLLEEGEDRLPHHADLEAVLGLLRLAGGDVSTASSTFERLFEEGLCDMTMVPWVGSGLARIKLAENRADAAVAAAEQALRVIEQKGVWPWATDVAPVLVEALLHARQTEKATEFVHRFRDGLEGRADPAAAGALRVCRGLLAEAEGEVERAAREFAAAERCWRALPRPYEAARAREHRGRSLLATQPDRGQKLLVEAMDGYRTLGAQWDAGRVRATLRRRGFTPPHRAGRKGYGSELSPREHEVVELASDGLSNREIALSLTVSRSTVEHHMSSAMRKLGATSRHELGDLLEGVSDRETATK